MKVCTPLYPYLALRHRVEKHLKMKVCTPRICVGPRCHWGRETSQNEGMHTKYQTLGIQYIKKRFLHECTAMLRILSFWRREFFWLNYTRIFSGPLGNRIPPHSLQGSIASLGTWQPIFRGEYQNCTDVFPFAEERLTTWLTHHLLWRMRALLSPPSDCQSDALAEWANPPLFYIFFSPVSYL